MPSDIAAGSRLSLLLVSVMILPSLLAIVSTNEVSEEMEIEQSSKGSMEIPSYIPNANDSDSDSDVYGWISDKGNIGAAHLFHRTATYVPIQDWEQRTGEGVISGWHVLGRTYPIPSDWKAELEDIGLECRTFFSPQGLHCNVPKLSTGDLMEAGVIGAFRLSESDKIAPDAKLILQGFSNEDAVKIGDKYIMLLLLSGTEHSAELMESGVEILDIRSGRFADVVVDTKEIEMLSKQNFVEWIEPTYAAELDNEMASEIIGGDWVADPSNMMSFGGALTDCGSIGFWTRVSS